MQYRAEIDGMRALAVVPVILFHAGLPGFSGGYVGVDVFFVISGFLITAIIVSDLRSGSFSMLQFYERRIRRIFPALFVVCLVCVPFALLWMIPFELKNFGRSLASVFLLSSNFLFYSESGYFAYASELKPLLHTWSLSVEAQFYLVFPILLLFLHKLGRSGLIAGLTLVSLISLGLSESISRSYPEANFYLLPTRLWELGLGAIFALCDAFWARFSGSLGQILSAIGIGLLAIAFSCFAEDFRIPGFWALIPVSGTLLLIAFARPATLVGKALRWPPLVGVGLISYSAYLWHYPLLAFARIRSLNEPPTELLLSLIALAFLLSFLSWRFVELPFRKRTRFQQNQVYLGTAALSFVAIFIGVSVVATNGLPGRAPPEIGLAVEGARDDTRSRQCSFGQDRPFDQRRACVYGSFDRDIFIWGDSQARTLAVGLAEAVNGKKANLVQYTSNACVPAVGYRWAAGNYNCFNQNRLIADALVQKGVPRTVILAGRWTLFREHTRFDNSEGGIEPGKPNYPIFGASPEVAPGDDSYAEQQALAVEQTVEALLKAGNRVVLVYPIPEVGWDVPHRMARQIMFGLEGLRPISTDYEVFRSRNARATEMLDGIADHRNLIRVRPDRIFCDTIVPGRCAAEAEGRPLYLDDDHLNRLGARMLSAHIVEVMAAAGWI